MKINVLGCISIFLLNHLEELNKAHLMRHCRSNYMRYEISRHSSEYTMIHLSKWSVLEFHCKILAEFQFQQPLQQTKDKFDPKRLNNKRPCVNIKTNNPVLVKNQIFKSLSCVYVQGTCSLAALEGDLLLLEA